MIKKARKTDSPGCPLAEEPCRARCSCLRKDAVQSKLKIEYIDSIVQSIKGWVY